MESVYNMDNVDFKLYVKVLMLRSFTHCCRVFLSQEQAHFNCVCMWDTQSWIPEATTVNSYLHCMLQYCGHVIDCSVGVETWNHCSKLEVTLALWLLNTQVSHKVWYWITVKAIFNYRLHFNWFQFQHNMVLTYSISLIHFLGRTRGYNNTDPITLMHITSWQHKSSIVSTYHFTSFQHIILLHFTTAVLLQELHQLSSQDLHYFTLGSCLGMRLTIL